MVAVSNPNPAVPQPHTLLRSFAVDAGLITASAAARAERRRCLRRGPEHRDSVGAAALGRRPVGREAR
jgi:hypothetical protein